MEAVARRDVENGLAQTNRLGRDLDGLVIGDEFEGCSSEKMVGGAIRSVLSLPEARMLVSFFSFVGFTFISSERAFSPTIIPS